jgi:ribosomal protein S18 acetylase RimI-like enzyme
VLIGFRASDFGFSFEAMTIRPATADDVPGVLPLVAKLAALHEAWDPQRYDYKPGVEQRYDRWLRSRTSDDRSVFLVAEREGRIVAFLIATVVETIPIYRREQTGYFHDMWVEPEYRNEGIARRMTMLAIEAFGKMGITQIRLETATANEPARKLFESCGFRISSIEMLGAFPASPQSS